MNEGQARNTIANFFKIPEAYIDEVVFESDKFYHGVIYNGSDREERINLALVFNKKPLFKIYKSVIHNGIEFPDNNYVICSNIKDDEGYDIKPIMDTITGFGEIKKNAIALIEETEDYDSILLKMAKLLVTLPNIAKTTCYQITKIGSNDLVSAIRSIPSENKSSVIYGSVFAKIFESFDKNKANSFEKKRIFLKEFLEL